MSNYIPVYPLWFTEDASAFTYDIRAAAEQLNISEREAMRTEALSMIFQNDRRSSRYD